MRSICGYCHQYLDTEERLNVARPLAIELMTQQFLAAAHEALALVDAVEKGKKP